MSEKYKYHQVIPEIPRTAVDIYRMLPEGTRCEVIFNELIMSPAPSRDHQLLLIKLTSLLFQFLQDNPIGTLLSAPFDVYIGEQQSVVQPDLFVVLNSEQDIIKPHGVHGAPSVIIEILSTNRAYDTKRKRALYEKAGVKEYFMIDPENKTATLLTLDASGIYQQTYEAIGVVKSTLLACDIAF